MPQEGPISWTVVYRMHVCLPTQVPKIRDDADSIPSVSQPNEVPKGLT